MKTLPFFFNQCLDKKRLKKLILWSLSFQGEYKTLQMIEDLKTLGFQYATSAGVSLSIDDLTIPPKKRTAVLESEALILQSVQGRAQGNRTAIEEIQTVVDTWHRTSETVKDHVIDFFEATNILNPVYMMAFSGARGNVSQVRQLVGMRGLMADPKGDIIGYAIRSNFREGLTITEYMISAYGARKGVVDTALRTADAGYLTRRLVDVAQHVIVQRGSCGTKKGILLQPIIDGGKTVLKVEDRLIGRVLARDLYMNERKMASRNDAIDHNLAFDITNAGAKGVVEAPAKRQQDQQEEQKTKGLKIYVRSPLTCDLSYGVCQLCYGWSFTQNRLVPLGEAVGVMAGQSIGEPGTQLTMRTFHTGGVFTGEVQGEFRSPQGGIIHYPKAFPGVLVRTPYGQIAFLVKEAGSLVIRDAASNKETVVDVPTHTALFLREGETVSDNQILGLPGGLDGQGNDKVETRKIVFSEFDGEVFFQNVAQKRTPFPEKLSEKLRRLEAEARRRRTLRRQYMNDTRAERFRVKKYYTLTSRVGTMWILAGRKIDPVYKTLPILRTSGQVVDSDTIVSREAILSPAEGFIVRTNAAKKPPVGTPVLLALGPQYRLDQQIDEKALVKTVKPLEIASGDEAYIYQPRIHSPFTKVHFDAIHNTFVVRCRAYEGSVDDGAEGKDGPIFVIPDYTTQIRDQEIRHHIDHTHDKTTNQLKKVLYPWSNRLEWRGKKRYSHVRNLSVFYYQAGDKIQEDGVFLWQEDQMAKKGRRRGLLFCTPYRFQHLGNEGVDATRIEEAWTTVGRQLGKVATISQRAIRRAIASKTTWCNEGDACYLQSNLQGHSWPLRAVKAGVCTETILETGSPTPLVTRNITPTIKLKSDKRRQSNPREQEQEQEMVVVSDRSTMPFPFGQKSQSFSNTVLEHTPGWLYLPSTALKATKPTSFSFEAFAGNASRPQPHFPGQTITSTPILMSMECHDETPIYPKTCKSLYQQVLSPWQSTTPLSTQPLTQQEVSREEISGPNAKHKGIQGRRQALRQALRRVAVLRHPRLLSLIKEEANKVQEAVANYIVLSHPKNSWYPVFGTEASRLDKEKGRFAKHLFGYIFDPMLTSIQKGVHARPAGHSKGARSHLLSVGILYQPMTEFSLDRISHRLKTLENSHNFELGPMIDNQPVGSPPKTGDLSDRTSVYTAFQEPYSGPLFEKGFADGYTPLGALRKAMQSRETVPTVAMRKFITRTVWSKQRPSRLMPNERPRRLAINPLLVPSRSYLAQSAFICRFLLQFEPNLEQKEKVGHWKVDWSPPWYRPMDKITGSSLTISFVKQPPLHTKEDEIFHPPGTWLNYGEPFIRRRQRSGTFGEVYRTVSNDCLVVDKKDMTTYAFSQPMAAATVAIGDIIRFGAEIEAGVGIPAAGQVIILTPTTITVRKGQPILFYNSGLIHVKNYQSIPQGHPLVTLSYQRLITGDIVQGIPKVEQLFEGSQAKDKDSEMKLSQLLLTKFRTALDKSVPPEKAYEESVRMIQHKIIENIQKVYLSQGVTIADIHFEIIVRRMTAWGKIRATGKSGLFRHEIIPIHRIEKINAGLIRYKGDFRREDREEERRVEREKRVKKKMDKLINETVNEIDNDLIIESVDTTVKETVNASGTDEAQTTKKKKKLTKEEIHAAVQKKRALYEPVIVGISASASNAESFLSAASFQETSRVLTRDALEGKTDFLRGLKERVILGDLIPAGTGFIEHVLYIATPTPPTPPLQPLPSLPPLPPL
jgi:DNA-directed RNA polymerase beta' subunit